MKLQEGVRAKKEKSAWQRARYTPIKRREHERNKIRNFAETSVLPLQYYFCRPSSIFVFTLFFFLSVFWPSLFTRATYNARFSLFPLPPPTHRPIYISRVHLLCIFALPGSSAISVVSARNTFIYFKKICLLEKERERESCENAAPSDICMGLRKKVVHVAVYIFCCQWNSYENIIRVYEEVLA